MSSSYRGITILRPEVPGALYIWAHDETDAHGAAETIDEAKTQIDRHLGWDDAQGEPA
ncbi:hypothetical protein PE067_08140 [Paracoccus sp. DMF-8]|uniref:hypothetical protein n=1 Tax=Paracoccus sp. DMF-8 TaxID=3019445 RepID=UPI0023E855E4|nr:hypothetical protein [Paracoccus sp. DMF-8]MDF3606097.1 hypothetical protein [Paracoccus sp. DMF-8]